jgi:hypothetical protein
VGAPADTGDIEAIVRDQLELESAIPTTPAPQVSVRVVDAANGYVVASIAYADPSTMAPVQLNISTG